MEIKKLIPLLILIPFTVAAETLEEKVNRLEEALLDVQLKSEQIKYDIGGNFRLGNHSLSYEDNDDDESGARNLLRMDMMVNLNFDVNPKTRFYTSLAMSKYFNVFLKDNDDFNDNANDEESPLWDLRANNNMAFGPLLFVPRAYFDYRASKNLTVSAGRLPTFQGPPYEVKDGISRQGTYPMSAYNLILDGVALTYNLSRYVNRRNSLKFRFLYTPLQNVDFTDPQQNLASANKDSTTREVPATFEFYNLMLEYENTTWSWAKKAQFIFYYFLINDSTLPSAAYTGANLDETKTDYRRDEQTASILMHFENLYQSNISFYQIYVQQRLDGQGDTYVTAGPSEVGIGLRNGPYTGYSSVTGLYFKSKDRKNILGIETNRSSRWWSPYSGIDEDPLNSTASRGSVDHFYYTREIERNMKLRLGHIIKKDDFDFSGDDVDLSYTSTYLQVRLDF